MENSEEVWMIHGKDEDGCGIRIRRIEPEWDMLCTCQETGGTFRVQQAGDVDGRSFMDGIRIVRFYPVSGDAHLEAGFHMIPTVGTGAKPSPEQLAVSEDKVRKFEYMWTSRKDEFVLVGIGRKGDPDETYMFMTRSFENGPSIADPFVYQEVIRRMKSAGVAVADDNTVMTAMINRRMHQK